jgi:hypothetical protein
MIIEALGCNKKSDAQYLYDYDDNLVEKKTQERYDRVIVNNILYRITLGDVFNGMDVYQLNCKIILLQCYITLDKPSEL